MKRSLSFKKDTFSLFLILFLSFSAFAQEAAEHHTESHAVAADSITGESHHEGAEKLDIGKVILEHVTDSHVWHLSESAVIPLPIIVYSSEKGFETFSSSHFFEHHQAVEYNGYRLADEKIYLTSTGEQVTDFSITKNVLMLFINAFFLIVILFAVSRAYKKNTGKSPKGIQSFIEPVILFVVDGIAKPSIGPQYKRFLPYLLTLFFFILFGNLLGLLPGAANLTGNIAVTAVLAILTFLIVNFNGNKTYWGHIFWTPGVPLWLRPLILVVELIGVFTKPFSLTVRLFVAITAGHIVLLALISLTFIFENWFVGIGASIFVILISLIELLVAGIQAYVFTLFTALYIGSAVVEHGHETEHSV